MTETLAIVDILCAFVLMKLIIQITDNWGFKSPQARWAALRRFVYLAVSVALFSKGMLRIEGEKANLVDGIDQVIVLVGLMLFPSLRAFGLISQDKWQQVNGR